MRYLLTLGSVLLSSFLSYAQTITLKDALQKTRENSPILKTEKYNIKISETDLITAKLRPNPLLNNQTLQLTSPDQFPAGTNFTNAKNRQVWWQLTKPFQPAKIRENKIKYANKKIMLTDAEYLETERNLLFEVSQAWLDSWFAQVNLDIILKAQNILDTLVYINQIRYNSGEITATDAARTQLLANQYKIQVKNAKQNLENALQSLNFFLGSNEKQIPDSRDDFSYFPKFTSIENSNQEALKNRADYLQAQKQVELAKANVELQKSLFTPTPELGIIYNPQNSIPYWGFYGTVEIPIFNRNQGEIEKARLELNKTEQNLIRLEQQIKTQVHNAYLTLQTNQKNLEEFNSIIEQSDKILNSVRFAYLKGGTTIIDFLEAQRTWFDTQQLYFEMQYNYKKSYLSLLYETGTINKL